MSYPIDRVQLFDRDMNPLRELAPSEVFSRVRTEEVNGEHALVIVTTRRLEEGWRALTVDGTGKWREWVLTEPDESHESGKTAIGTYRFVWSLQYDLTYSYFHDTDEGVSIGMGSDTQALVAAQHVLEGVAGWSVGPCDAPDIAKGTGCVFIRESAWSKLSKLVECSGVEVDSVIEVSNLYGVTARKLCLRSHVGNEDALLRFDWSRDLTGIRRTPDPGPYYCRVVPLGKGESEYADDDETTYEYPIDITEEPDGQGGFYPYYLQDDEAALAFRIKAGDGTYVYPTIAVTYSEDDPELLLNAALAELHDYTRPGVTYEADVVQLAQAGMDVRGVALGDEVQCVDYGFNPDAGLRIQGRVLKIEVDELSPETTTQLTIGQLRDSITDLMKDMGQSLDELQHNNDKITEQMRSMTTARYIDELLDRINAEINATGGYAYFVPGEGIITYDVAVADPLVGSEATQVVQVKGGSVRIANSKNTQFSGIDDWNWKTVFQAGYIGTDLVTATNVVTGILEDAAHKRDANTGNYWNLDTGDMRVSANITVGGANNSNGVMQVVDASGDIVCLLNNQGISGKGQFELVTSGFSTGGTVSTTMGVVTIPMYSNMYTRSTEDGRGLLMHEAGDSTTNEDAFMAIGKTVSSLAHGYHRTFSIGATGPMRIVPYSSSTNSSLYQSFDSEGIHAYGKASNGNSISIGVGANGPELRAASTNGYSHYIRLSSDGSMYGGTVDYGNAKISGFSCDVSVGSIGTLDCDTLRVSSYLWASGIKNRVVSTTDFGDRLLYCYETASPMFGDVGSGVTDEDGIAYVPIDPIFAETVVPGTGYQVFIQACDDCTFHVPEKAASHFVVKGAPNSRFDWEVKVRQVGTDGMRLDSATMTKLQHDEVTNPKNDVRNAAREGLNELRGQAYVDMTNVESSYGNYIQELAKANMQSLGLL